MEQFTDSHGYLNFNWRDNTLYVKAFGPFNTEGMIEATNQYFEVINNNISSFSIIEVLNEDALGSPQVMENVGEFWKKLENYNCISLALIYVTDMQRAILEKHLPKCGKAFDNITKAEQWVHSRYTH